MCVQNSAAAALLINSLHARECRMRLLLLLVLNGGVYCLKLPLNFIAPFHVCEPEMPLAPSDSLTGWPMSADCRKGNNCKSCQATSTRWRRSNEWRSESLARPPPDKCINSYNEQTLAAGNATALGRWILLNHPSLYRVTLGIANFCDMFPESCSFSLG